MRTQSRASPFVSTPTITPCVEKRMSALCVPPISELVGTAVDRPVAV